MTESFDNILILYLLLKMLINIKNNIKNIFFQSKVDHLSISLFPHQIHLLQLSLDVLYFVPINDTYYSYNYDFYKSENNQLPLG